MAGLKTISILVLVCLSVFRPSIADVSDNVERLIDTQAELLREIFNELNDEIENLETNFENELRELETRLLADTESKVAELQSQIDDLKARETVPVEKETVPVAKKPTKPPPPPPTTTVPTTEPPTTTTKTTTKAAGPPSYRHCQDVRDSGFDINGNYMIDPDGVDGPMEEFEVYCNMTDNGAYTTIGVQQASTMPIRIKGLDDPGANVFTPEYLLNAEQILAVVTASTECRQYISYSCTSAVLLAYHKKKKLHHGWLLSRDGEEMINWGGAPTNSLSCACGVTGTCINDNVKCNCDANESKQKLSDSGYLDDIDTLPIKSVHLGDVAGKKEVGGLTLGSLECKV
ncbi:contactin-associated protein 1-like [Antedon mediterranea]|uniref:contactin-associated protein 1-like n=1 Tax=Antedon mediterranea TaxID=105859 RepID=UPI003AF5410D